MSAPSAEAGRRGRTQAPGAEQGGAEQGDAARAPAPPLVGAPARRRRPACPRAHPSLARLARGRSGARARPRAGRGQAAAHGARPRTCQTWADGLELRAPRAPRERGRPRSSAVPGRAVRGGPAEPAEGGEMSGGPAAAPQDGEGRAAGPPGTGARVK